MYFHAYLINSCQTVICCRINIIGEPARPTWSSLGISGSLGLSEAGRPLQ